MSPAPDAGGLPDWVAWLVASVSAIGNIVAGGWVWLTRQRDQTRKTKTKLDRDDQQYILSQWRTYIEEIQQQLTTAQEATATLQKEYVELMVQNARKDERIARLEADVKRLESEIESLRKGEGTT